MKALAAFYFIYEPFEIRLFYEEGYLCIRYRDAEWYLPHEYYTHPKDIHELIQYHHEARNWIEMEL